MAILPGFPLGQPTSTPATFSPQRHIGDIQADVTIIESHDDELTITNHPVEQGAAITDHAFKNPARLQCIVGFSNSSDAAGGDDQYINDMYQSFLDLQVNREIIDVRTGRRNYNNMLVAGVALTTNQETENSAIITVTLQEIILVQTQTVSVPPNETQQQPQKTATASEKGVKQANVNSNPPDIFTNHGATNISTNTIPVIH